MATFHSDPQAHALDSGRRFGPADAKAAAKKPASVLDLLGPDDPLHQEMEQLLAEQQQTKPAARADNHPPSAAEPLPLAESEELAVLRAENPLLRARVEELEQIVEATTNQSEELWAEQQKEYEMLLDEKSEVIRTLHQQLQELKEAPPGSDQAAAAAPAIGDGDNLALQQEVLSLKEQLEQQRRQLEEDEQSMMDQMRQMELALAKERVEMARQRGELQRLYQDLQRDIELAQKDGGLRERLLALQQQQRAPSELTAPPGQKAPTPGQKPQGPAARRALPTQPSLPANGDQRPPRPSSGFIRRLFG